MFGEQEPEGTSPRNRAKKCQERKPGETTIANATLLKIKTSCAHWRKLRRLFEEDRESPAISEEIVKSPHIK